MPDIILPPLSRHPSLDLDAWQRARYDSSVLIADGNQVRVTVRNGHLSVADGVPGTPRTRVIPRMPATLSRLIILGGHGYVTVEAQRWLASMGIPWAILDTYADDAPIAMSGLQRDDARLLRAQASASEGGALEATGIEITRKLITAKLDGQARNLEDVFHDGNAVARLRALAGHVQTAATLTECRALEAQGASVYWQTWAGRVHVPYSPDDMSKVPAHWVTYAGRTSLTTDYERNKDATDPVNAMLNYGYRVGEIESVHACHAYGLHSALGILHADKQGRDSMALDLLETIRPAIDRVILDMLDTGLGVSYGADGKPRYLDRRLIRETREGTARLVPPLTHILAGHSAVWGSEVRRHAENTARALALASTAPISVPRGKRTRVPVTSCKRVRLVEGTGITDLLPDSVWTKVQALIPAPRPSTSPNRAGRPADTSQDRPVIAALSAHDLLGVPWGSIPVQVSPSLCNTRRGTWTRLPAPGEYRTAWEAITEVLRSAGHLPSLISAGYDG